MDFFRHRRSPGRPRHPDILTPGEWRVLEELRAGRTNAEIAVRLGVSVNTVRTHVSRMLAKLDLPNRRALAQWDGEPAAVTREAGGRFRFGVPLFGWLPAKGAGIAAGVVATVVLGVALAVGLPLVMADEEGERATVPPAPIVATTPAATPTATPAPRPTTQDESVVWVVDASTGAHTEVYRGRDIRLNHRQWFTRDGGGFWLVEWLHERAVRYGFDGEAQETLDGVIFGIAESPDGSIRAYGGVPDDEGSRAVVEGAGRRYEIKAIGFDQFFSPDARYLAYNQWEGDRGSSMLQIMLLDLETGAERELARGVGPPEGSGHVLRWSPSGRYLVYADYGAWPPVGTERAGMGEFIVDIETGASFRLGDWPGATITWQHERDVVVVQPRSRVDFPGGSSGFPPDPRLLFIEAASGTVIHSVELPRDERVYARLDPTGRLIVAGVAAVDLASGDIVREWQHRIADAVWTGGDPAAALYAPGCDGLLVEHPALSEPRCIEGGRYASWSPNGRTLAVSTEAPWRLIVFDAERDLETEIGRTGPYPLAVWHHNGTHLMVAWGIGP